jgi:hypothetical protein
MLLLGYFGRREQILACQRMSGIQAVDMTLDASRVQFLTIHRGKRLFVLVKFHEDDGLTVREAIICDGKKSDYCVGHGTNVFSLSINS